MPPKKKVYRSKKRASFKKPIFKKRASFKKKYTSYRKRFSHKRGHRHHHKKHHHGHHGHMQTIHGMPFAVGDRNFCKMKWAHREDGVLVSGTLTDYQIRIGDIYDPWVGLGGSSAAGYNIMNTSYASRIVHGMKITLRIESTDLSQDDVSGTFVMLPASSSAASTITTVEQAIIQRRAKVRDMTLVYGSKSAITFSHYYSVAEIDGQQNFHFGNYIATGAASPALTPMLHLYMLARGNAIVPILTCNFLWECTFYTEWFGQRSATVPLMDLAIKHCIEDGTIPDPDKKLPPPPPPDHEKKLDTTDEKAMDEAFEDLKVEDLPEANKRSDEVALSGAGAARDANVRTMGAIPLPETKDVKPGPVVLALKPIIPPPQRLSSVSLVAVGSPPPLVRAAATAAVRFAVPPSSSVVRSPTPMTMGRGAAHG